MNKHELTNLATYGDTEGIQQAPVYGRKLTTRQPTRFVMRHRTWSNDWALALNLAYTQSGESVLDPMSDNVRRLQRRNYKELCKVGHSGCRTSTKRGACGGPCRVRVGL